MPERARPKTLRCAIYTRKSSEEGLEQDFNSLHAQREACEAYVASQRHEGWKVLKTAYDDGGFSGGSMERPALKRLLTDIGSGLIDVVVVYKVDRLTRALADFAKIVEIFDAQGISFVSVTQQFNTTTSMGRLTLNVLLSFAQFEREVTGERIRDKIAASKKKGLWMGGFVPLGYRPDERTLVIHVSESEIVRTIFALYIESGSVAKVQAELEQRGIARPRATTSTSGRSYGGRAFSRGEIYKLLSNPTYVGEIGHKRHRYAGQHPAIIDRETWTAVQARLAGNTRARYIRLNAKDPSLLAGLLYDDQGNRLTPTHANKQAKRYRYYALQPSDGQIRARGRPPESARRWRIAAVEIEGVVIERLCALLDDRHWLLDLCSLPDSTIERRQAITAKGQSLAGGIRSAGGGALRELLLGILARVVLGEADIRIDIKRVGLLACLGLADEIVPRTAIGGDASLDHHDFGSAVAADKQAADNIITFTFPLKLRRRGVETKLVIESADGTSVPRQPDRALVKMVAHAHQWWDDLVANRFPTVRALARAYNKDERYVARTLAFAFLAPPIVEPIFEFKRRTLVHFAVDTESVLMTTRLAGTATHFLPFNRGCDGGAGNPVDPAGRTYRTAYLWEEVLQRDSLLDLLARFIHLQTEEKRDDQGRKVKKETMIFPRYHQLQAVRLLVGAARDEGVGYNYLIEHSAGSGKSNTIGWLAHRLASLHDIANNRVFDSVIVVTDRVVLDQQLQDTIYQFEHKRGVVQRIDESSRQLAEALENAIPVIITTLQKFPFVSRQLVKMAEERGASGTGLLPTRRCAVIIDEAHSSQGGETATDLREVLGGKELQEEARRYAAEEGMEGMEELFRSMAKRGRQANLSFFAFTATPKHKTLAVFGRNGQPAHRYTMRQAIEEEFILDVLKHYTTYATYFRLLKTAADDPNVERKKAAKALGRFMRLHPHNIAQKTEVMVEHFNAVTRHKIGGRAKAMVVTGSRLEAVRYKQSFDLYIQEKGYPIRSLVAFSGTVQDDKLPGVTYAEETMNGGIREKELPEKFSTQEYQVLLVAEKYQTGFDQPLLHTMYVDKRLGGIQAVQTLSRLNRTHPLKEDTFVLDFVNDREEIREAFKTYYEGAEIGEEVDPARMYQLRGELDASGVYLSEEVKRFCEVYFKPKQRQSAMDHQAMNVALDPAVSRFTVRQRDNEGEAEEWRGRVQAFRNLYGFLSQVIPYQDSDLERLYVFLRHLAAKLPRRKSGPAYQFDDEVRLEYYRLQKISEGSISLREGQSHRLDGPTEVGSGLAQLEPMPLSQLVHIVNERFGTDFNQADQLFFDQIVEAAMADDGLRQAAAVNPGDKFELVFRNLLETLFVERMDQNEEIFVRFMNDPAFQRIVTGWMASEAYRKLREAAKTSPTTHELAP